MSQEPERSMPCRRINHCMTSARQFLFIYGGCHCTSYTHYNDFWSYNTISCVWKRYELPQEKPDTCLHSSICSDGKFVYLFGGSCFIPRYRQTNTVISFDITNETWKTLFYHTDVCDINTPPPMDQNLLLYHNGSLYVIGGFDNHRLLDTMYKFCLKTSTWFLVKQNGVKPSNRSIGGTVYENKIYMFECVEPRTKRFRKILIFDFSTDTWTKRGTISKNRKYPDSQLGDSCAFSKNIGYISGGNILHPYTYLRDIWKIDLESLKLFRVDYILEVGIVDHCTSIVDDCYLFSFGGTGYDVDEDKTLQKIIIRPPTLYRLCLESAHRSQNEESLSQALPISTLDDLNLNSNN